MVADSTQPFDSTILFDFCPPGKRHGTEIEGLSGGEKSIAALAFVFSLAVVKKPQLMLLDEVDCFLDQENVKRIQEYIDANLPDTQLLVVSHKEDFAATARSLQGVYMDRDTLSSQTLSLDLTKFQA